MSSTEKRLRRLRRQTLEICFGDGAGFTLFLACVAFLVLTWRVGTFFNDIGLFVPALDRLAEGHLSLGAPTELDQGFPGMYYEGGQVYARNYGELVFSLPAYWLVGLVDATLLRALVVLGWSGLLAVLSVRIATHYGRRRIGIAVGGALGLLSMAANAATFRVFLDSQKTIIALQLTTMLFAAFTGVFIYRLLARRYGTKIGVIAGGLTVFASPIGFWGTLPKRHAFTAFFVVLAMYALARSREEESDADAPLGQAGFRAVAYASAGLLAWIHAPEGFTLFLAVALVDLPTARRNDPRTLAVIGTAFAASLVPFFLTNFLISGNPLEPPRFLRTYRGLDSLPGGAPDPNDIETQGGTGGSDGQSAGGVSGGTGRDSLFGVDLESLFPSTFVRLLQVGVFRYVDGLLLAIGDLDRVLTVFVRRGNLGHKAGNLFFDDGTNLSVLESLPVAVAVAVVPLRYAVTAARERVAPSKPDLDPIDAFAVVFVVLLSALYIHRLPLRVMVTVRYLHPIYPLLIYGAFRQQWVRDLVTEHTREALGGYAATALFGVPLAIVPLLYGSYAKGETVQLIALAALAGAGVLALAALAGSDRQVIDRLGAVTFGVVAAIPTVFILLCAFIVMHYGPSALPFVDAVSADVRFATITW